ncbi:DedA family protein [Sphingomonas jatrophae]|uniref:Membrane protein DedA, SNARE-associated domain n=1 Tax=Sphingomonas jatrophae TaxID=1166337 RepID=A0A1I6L2B3_9SPHN|nr:VTT domain-containing protein [Sphingomonas jatrophae]SFR97350.1 membrane protein DedA, SNARE-associated domain [Sphingomonas jatrophae]
MIDLAAFVARYGVAAVALGAGLEGEAAVLTGGVLAATGLFQPLAVGIAAFAGSATADQLLFLGGRRGRSTRFVEAVRAKPAFARVLGWIEARPLAFVIAFRFIYGCRVAGPVALGVSAVPARLFVPLNLLSAALWAALFTFLGWRFGPLVEPFLKRLFGHAPLALAVLAGAVLIGGGALLLRRHFKQS